MKKSHLFIVIIIAIAISIIISTAGNTSQYVSFSEAFELADKGNNAKVHVIGELMRDSTNKIVGIEYKPLIDPNYLTFILVDEKDRAQKVICYNPPASIQDFQKSEKIVIIGSVKKNQFIASKILIKCPSKYQEDKIKIQ